MWKVFFLTFFASINFSYADIQFPVSHQKERILPLLENIERYVELARQQPGFDSKTSTLNSESFRNSLRDLQNLMRLYAGKKKTIPSETDEYAAFNGYYELAKEFEDHISHLRDYKSFYQSALNSGNQAAITKFENILNAEKASYASFIEESAWFKLGEESLAFEIRQKVETFEWPSLYDDRNHFLKKMASKMKKLHEKEYHMDEVEDGMHELRRDARRLSYYNLAINMVDYDFQRACPLDAPANMDPQRLGGESYSCGISSCLMDKVQRASGSLASLKTQGASYEARGEEVPEHIIESAKEIHDDLKGSEVFLHLWSQLRECRSPKE